MLYGNSSNEWEDVRNAGVHDVKCDTSKPAGGACVYRLQAGDRVHTRKVLVVR